MRKRIILFLAVALLSAGCQSKLLSGKIFATRTPRATATATLTPTATATPTPPPTPTPQPAARVKNADNELFLGDYEQARRDYQDAFAATSNAQVQAAATYGIGRALYLQHNYSTAINTLKGMIKNYPQSTQLADAYFYLGQSLDAQKLYDQAAEAYGKFLELRPGTIDWYVQELRGDDLMAASNPGAAADAYAASVKAPQQGTTDWIALKMGRAYAAKGDYATAITTYLDVYKKSTSDYAKAQANLLMGQAYTTLGKPEQAQARYLDSVNNFPKAYDTYSALVQLVNDGVTVNDLSRGMVDYYAGQYGLAIDAFTRYIASADNVDASPYHYRALAHLA
ncbi:MAG TPA: tetratricopeptide repeat protein, partial [Anaerolineaceae bacterium]